MGQKINPLSLRIGDQKDWKTKSTEKKKLEVGGELEKDRQTFSFVTQILHKNRFSVTDLIVKNKDSEVFVFVSLLSVFSGKNQSPTALKQIFVKTDKHEEMSVTDNNQAMSMLISFLKKGLSYIYPNKRIRICLNYANKQLNLSKKKRVEAKKKFLTLRRYKNQDFFVEGFDTTFALTKDRKIAHPLLEFLIKSLKNIKRLKPLLKFIEKSLKLVVDDPESKTTGARIEIRGRFTKAGRARFFVLKIGDVPRHTRRIPLEYVSGHTQNKNGSFGIKIWVVGKKNVSSA